MKAATVRLTLFAPWVLALAASAAEPAKPGATGRPPPKAPAADAAPTEEAVPAIGPERVFEFEKRTGAVDEALAVALGRKRPVPDDAEEAGEIMAKVAKAKATLRANSKAAASAIIADLEELDENDAESHAALFSLLGVVGGEDTAIAYWSKKLTTGSPRQPPARAKPKKSTTPDQPKPEPSEHEDPAALIRYMAIAQLYRAALDGSEKARTAILDAAKSPHRDVKISAVQYSYALGRQRWKVRQELEQRLAPADHHLLNRY